MKLLNKILLLVLLSFWAVVASASYTAKSASGDFLQAQELYQGKIKKLGWEASGKVSLIATGGDKSSINVTDLLHLPIFILSTC